MISLNIFKKIIVNVTIRGLQLMQEDPEDYAERQAKIEREARRKFEEAEFERGGAGASAETTGTMTTEGGDKMLENLGITSKTNNKEQNEEKNNSLDTVNQMLYSTSNDGHSRRLDGLLDKEYRTKTIEERHSEHGISEYEGGFQFLSDDGRVIKSAVERLMSETELDIGQVNRSLSTDCSAEDRGTKMKLYQEIQTGDYETQKALAEETDIHERTTSDYLTTWEQQGLIDRDGEIKLTEDGYEVAQTLRGLEAYAKSKE